MISSIMASTFIYWTMKASFLMRSFSTNGLAGFLGGRLQKGWCEGEVMEGREGTSNATLLLTQCEDSRQWPRAEDCQRAYSVWPTLWRPKQDLNQQETHSWSGCVSTSWRNFSTLTGETLWGGRSGWCNDRTKGKKFGAGQSSAGNQHQLTQPWNNEQSKNY